LSFILPTVEIVQVGDPVAQADGLMLAFARVYQMLWILLTPEFAFVGVVVVIAARYWISFVVA